MLKLKKTRLNSSNSLSLSDRSHTSRRNSTISGSKKKSSQTSSTVSMNLNSTRTARMLYSSSYERTTTERTKSTVLSRLKNRMS